MGSKCSNLETPQNRSRQSSKRLTTTALCLKGNDQFKARYTTSKALHKDNSRLVGVRHRDTDCDYVCRIISRVCAPTKDPGVLGYHFQILVGLEHPHICKFVAVFEDDENWYCIYEKADTTTLFEHIQAGEAFEEEDAAEYTRQMCMALAVSHEQGVVHGRLSPSKVTIAQEQNDSDVDDEDTASRTQEDAPPAQVKLCDMGQGFILRHSAFDEWRRHQQDPSNPAPKQELLECLPPDLAWEEFTIADYRNLAHECASLDVWSLGCIVYHMLTGRPPHCASSLDVLVEKVKTGGVEFGEEWAELSAQARDATECMLKVNTGLRLSCSALLRHPWLRMPRSRLPKAHLFRLLHNIRDNASQGNFKRMVMRVIAQQLPVESREVGQIEQAFRFFDRNGDGVLGVPEICKCIRRLDLGRDDDLEDLEDIIAMLDRDGSSTVNLQEFVAGSLNPRHGQSAKKLWCAFNAFDRDHNGSVSIDEIEAIVRVVEAGLFGQEQVDGLVEEIREELKRFTSQDIDFDQFVYIMRTPGDSGVSTSGALTRDVSRFAFDFCGVDCYNVRKIKPHAWNWQQMSHSPPSVYRRQNLVALRRVGLRPQGSVDQTASQDVRGLEPGPGTASRGRRGKQPGQPGKR